MLPIIKSFFAKEPLIIRLFCGKWPIKIRGLLHPVAHLLANAANHMCHDVFIRDLALSHVTWLVDIWHDFELFWKFHSLVQTFCSFLVANRHMWHDSLLRDMTHPCVTCLIHVRDMPHSYAWHASFICGACLIYMCDMTDSYARNGSFIRVTWLIHMRDMAHSYAWHDSFICVTWLIYIIDMRDMTHLYAWRDSFICLTRLIHMCDMTHVTTDSYVLIPHSNVRYNWTTRGMTHSYV